MLKIRLALAYSCSSAGFLLSAAMLAVFTSDGPLSGSLSQSPCQPGTCAYHEVQTVSLILLRRNALSLHQLNALNAHAGKVCNLLLWVVSCKSAPGIQLR